MSHPALLGVLYAEDFDEEGTASPPEPEGRPEPELIEPSFSAAELEAARTEGREAGRLEAERGLLAARVRLLGQVAAALAEGRAAAAEMAEQSADGVARVMLAALNACLPGLCLRHGEGELRAVFRKIIPALHAEPRITIRTNPSMTAALQEEIARLDEEDAERIRLLPTGSIVPGDVRITWRDGSTIRNAANARNAIHAALAELGLPPGDAGLEKEEPPHA